MLEIKDLNVAYGTKLVLKDLSLDLKAGEVLGLIGPNGSGKSTLVRAVSGVIPVKSGTLTCLGHDLRMISPPMRARLLAVVPQARQLGGALTVQQTVLMGRTPYMGFLGRPSDVDLDAVRLAMQQTSVEILSDRRNAELSGGEQQRVLLARALAQRTPFMLLDEPTSHLDLKHQSSFLSLILELVKERNLGVLIAFHDLNLISAFTHRIALMSEGRIQALGTPKVVLTVQNIQEAYNTSVRIVNHPDLDTPMIIPDRR
jgi:cobalamin transport system ATP-binding protein